MAASSKFDFSGFSDGSTYPNGQRGSHVAASLERPGSFREASERRTSSPIPSTGRNGSFSSQADGINLFQTLVSDLKTVVDQRLPRPGEMRRSVGSILGVPAEDMIPATFGVKLSSSSVEEIKRLSSRLREGSVRARERAKAFGEAASKVDKFHSQLPRKRSRNDSSSIERSHPTLPGASASKISPHSHHSSGSLELGPQKSEEREKSAVPNRRMRTSLVDTDVRSNSFARQSGPTNKDRDLFKLVSGDATTPEKKSQGVQPVDGWEKSKMKKKRSAIKPDPSGSAVLARSHDSDREVKRGMQQKLVIDARPRLNNIHGFRPNGHEDNHAASPTSLIKMNTSVRGPRSNSGSGPKIASPNMNRVLGNSDDWEQLQSTNKSNGGTGGVNRKRSTSVLSSSPPVTQWGGQRPQKITRVARRSNLPPVVSTRDEYPLTGDDDVSGFPRRSSTNVSQQSNSRCELSESEESGVVDNKSNDMSKKFSETEKVAGLVLSSRKNKVAAEEDLEDNIRKNGKIKRGVSPARSNVSLTIENLHSDATTKQMKSARNINEKFESKPGRPPTKKWSERKGHTRPRPSMNGGPSDFAGESDDDREDLLAAADAALKTGKAHPKTIWNTLEKVLGFLSAEDVSFLNEQIRVTEEVDEGTFGCTRGQSLKDDLETNSRSSAPSPSVNSRNGYGGSSNGFSSLNECAKSVDPSCQTDNTEPFLEELVQENGSHVGVSICQALLSAIIEEEEIDNKEDCLYRNSFGNYDTSTDLKSNGFSFQSPRPVINSPYKANGGWAFTNETVYEDLGSNCMLDELLPDLAMTPSTVCSDYEYNQMGINDRILLELSEIGIYPEPVPYLEQTEDEEDIDEGIIRLKEKLHEQVAKKKRLLVKLEKAVKEGRESQQRELESIAMDKLVGIAYEKHMACLGSNPSSSKNLVRTNKQQATQAFVKRTLARCRKNEKTKISCFGEPLFRDMFLSVSSNNGLTGNINHSADTMTTTRVAPSRQSNASFTDKLTDQICATDDTWSTKLKKKELLLDDVVGSALRAPSVLGSSLVSSIKGKRSERDREGKGQSRVGTPKISRTSIHNAKPDKKNKPKPKQKATQPSASVNDLVGKPKPRETRKDEPGLHSNYSGGQDMSNDAEAMDLCNLQLPEIDVTDFGAQGQDISSWLNIEDDGFHDNDFMGLQIPMDDLSDVLS